MNSWQENFDPKLQALIPEVEAEIAPVRAKVQQIMLDNQAKVLQAFRDHNLSEAMFAPSTGYGYDDLGRDALEGIYAQAFGAEAALVRPQIISGTHAISTALFGVLRPGDNLLYLTGEPYDTMQSVVGMTGNGIGAFPEYKIGFDYVPLNPDGSVNFAQAKEKITEKTKMVAIQRSCGYAGRNSYLISEIATMCEWLKENAPQAVIFVDNCYGEFADLVEPTQVGADLMAGSLIKNPGGGLAKSGGYLAGRKDLVTMCAYRLTTPGVGAEGGAMGDNVRYFLQGFFLAPHVVGQAIQAGIYASALFEKLNLASSPHWSDQRSDIIQKIDFANRDKMVTFCQEIQKYSPVDSFVTPVPEYMPGYTDDVIMAAGTFVQGSSIELSADGPLRPPYRLYLQGGLTYEHAKIAITSATNEAFF